MKMRSSVFILILIVLFVGTNPCCADVVEPGTKDVSLYYQISNINEYPDYVFIIHGTPEPIYELLTDSEFSFYKLSEASIYALKKTGFNPEELENMNESQINALLENDSRFTKSNIQLSGSYGTVAETNPLEKAVIVLEIKSITENQLNINKKQIKYYFSDGSSETQNFKTQSEIPQPESDPYINNISIYVLIPLIILAFIILLIIRRK